MSGVPKTFQKNSDNFFRQLLDNKIRYNVIVYMSYYLDSGWDFISVFVVTKAKIFFNFQILNIIRILYQNFFAGLDYQISQDICQIKKP